MPFAERSAPLLSAPPGVRASGAPMPYAPVGTAPEAPADPKRWLVLVAFALNAGANAFLFMDYVTQTDATKEIFGFCNQTAASGCGEAGGGFVASTYSYSLLAVVPSAILVMMYIDRFNYAVSLLGISCNCSGAWLRWYSTSVAADGFLYRGRGLALVSSVLVGFAAAVCVVSYSSISVRWFPPSERTFATSCAVQSNYLGWACGAVIFPYAVGTASDLLDVLFYQACVLTVFFLVFAAVYRDRKPATGHQPQHSSFTAEVRTLCHSRQYVLQCMCYAVLAGVSFAIPSFQTTAFKSMNLTAKDAAWTNFSFIFAGVSTGMIIGRLCTSPAYFSRALKLMFLGTSLSLGGLIAMSWCQDLVSHAVLYFLLIVLMGLCGATSLGFIGIALSAVVETVHPVSSEVSGGAVEWWVQIWGFVLAEAGGVADSAYAFQICAVATWLVTMLMLTSYRQEFNKTGQGGNSVTGVDRGSSDGGGGGGGAYTAVQMTGPGHSANAIGDVPAGRGADEATTLPLLSAPV